MPDPFEPSDYLAYLRSRWRFVAICSGVALAVALAGSLLMTKKYTAAVALLIEPPAGSDPRAATAVSPVYLESLRTYERLASSDDLFARAAGKFELRRLYPGRPIERIKKSVLRVSIPRNTKILEIETTLPDAGKAHELALYLARETLRLHYRTARANDEELIAETRQRLEQAVERAKAAEAARARAAASRSRQELDALDAELQSAWVARDEQERRLRELEATAGFRTERLTLLDPGVVPERPSSPNLPLNLLAAFGLALAACWLYLTLEFGLRGRRAEAPRPALRVSAKS